MADAPRGPAPERDARVSMLYAAIYRPPQPGGDDAAAALQAIARDFSPRFEMHGADLVVVDVSGLERLLGPARVIGEELRRTAAARGIRAHVAVAATQTAAMVLAHAQPGLTIVARGGEADALAPMAIGILERIGAQTPERPPAHVDRGSLASSALARWGIKTLGELAALPAADLVARLGRAALGWQAVARGDDVRPLVPALEDERFESTLELEWPIEGLEPLSFVLTRLLEPLSTRLERRDRGAAVLHVVLRLVRTSLDAPIEHHRRLELPTPMRDVRSLRTLALLDLESHPPEAAIESVRIVIDPTPGRVLQHTLFARAHPTPEQIATLLARLGALMGQDRIGAPSPVDTYRPGAFAMNRFETEHSDARRAADVRLLNSTTAASALRRCRYPIPARVEVAEGRPVRVTTDRRGFAGGAVLHCAGPWRTSGNWWAGERGEAGEVPWNRDEWDVALNDGAVYRVFRDRDRDAWYIDAVID